MNFLRKYIFHSPTHYAVALALNIFMTLLVLFLKGFNRILAYVDAFSVAGAVSVLLGALFWVASMGTFHIFGYAFSALRPDRQYKDLYEYSLAKEEKQSKRKKTFVPYILVGVVFLVISFVLMRFVTFM